MVGESEKAADLLKEKGIDCEVLNLRSIRPLDRDGILKSLKKTNRLVCVEDGYPQSGVGSEIVASVMESEGWSYLDAPVERVTAWDVPLPYAKNLEQNTLPQVENIVKAVENVMKGVKL
jgi:pyruvate dehydrogenase E1 component beta subunit